MVDRERVLEEATIAAEGFSKATGGEDREREREERRVVKWKSPENGWVKINCDAAVDKDLGSGIGVVVRGGDEIPFMVAARRCVGAPRVEVAEGEALLWGLQIAIDQDIEYVVLESDCVNLVSKLNNFLVGAGQLGGVLGAIREAMRQLKDCSIVFVRRNGNKVANLLAQLRPTQPLILLYVVAAASSLHFFDKLNSLVLDDLDAN